MANTLVSATDLDPYPGAPFDQRIVDMAAAKLRLEVGWHIAPELTETRKVDSWGTSTLLLPTLHLVDVTAVRDVTGDAPEVIEGWKKSDEGILTLASGWPFGLEAVEVDMVHGYATTPLELLPVLADIARSATSDPRVTQERLGNWSRTFRSSLSGTDTGTAAELYSIKGRFA